MQWRLEVERVGPRLRTNLAAEQRDWRQHLEAAHASTQALAASWPDAKAVLTKLGSEVWHMLIALRITCTCATAGALAVHVWGIFVYASCLAVGPHGLWRWGMRTLYARIAA